MNKVDLPHYGLFGVANSGLHGQTDGFDKDFAVLLNEQNISVDQFKQLLTDSELTYSKVKESLIEVMSRAASLQGLGLFEKKEGGTAVGNWLRDTFGRKDGGSTVGNFLRSIFGQNENTRPVASSISGSTKGLDTTYGKDYGQIDYDAIESSKKPFSETLVGGFLTKLFGSAEQYANGIVNERFPQDQPVTYPEYGTINNEPQKNQMNGVFIGLLAIGLIGGGIYYANKDDQPGRKNQKTKKQ